MKPAAVNPWNMPCGHGTVEQILNGNDQVIGGQCATCLEVLWGIGTCSGCKKEQARLTYVLGEQQRYCSDQCRKDELARKRKEVVGASSRPR
jgi:hypothetical protein